MKKLYCIILLFFLYIGCASNQKNTQVFSEKDVIVYVTKDLLAKKDLLKNKKLAMFDFTTIDGKAMKHGKRLSNRILEKLIKSSSLTFIERSELYKILRAHGVEQTGVIDPNTKSKLGKIYGIQVMITGTITKIKQNAEIHVKVVDIVSGKIYAMSTAQYVPQENVILSERNGNKRLYKKDPEKMQLLNLTYHILQKVKHKHPISFLMITTNRHDPFIQNNPEIVRKFHHKLRIWRRNNPERARMLRRLRIGFKLMKEYDKDRYKEILSIKKKILSKFISP